MKAPNHRLNRSVFFLLVSVLALALTSPIASHAGQLDATFGTGGKVTTPGSSGGTGADVGTCTAVQGDGKVLVAGSADNGTDDTLAVLRYTAGGVLDAGFGTGGKAIPSVDGIMLARAMGMALQSDGKIVVAGYANVATVNVVIVLRFHGDIATGTPGTLDAGFGTGGYVTTAIGSDAFANGVALQADGKIVVTGGAHTGSHYGFMVARYTASGVLDTSFAGTGFLSTVFSGGDAVGYGVAVQGDGKIVLAGYSNDGTKNYITVMRYHGDIATGTPGNLDSGFNGGGTMTMTVGVDGAVGESVALQSDGKILVCGYGFTVGSTNNFALVRLTTAGALDTSFAGTGQVLTSLIAGERSEARGVAVAPDGKIIVAGNVSRGGKQNFAVARYHADAATGTPGTLDATFGSGGKVVTSFGASTDVARGVAVGSDGKIVAAGQSYQGSVNKNDFAAARYLPTGTVDRDFDGDGNMDLILQNGVGQIAVWYLDGSGVVTSGAFVSASALGDWRVACTGDFDGDGNADLILQNGVGQIAAWYLNGSGAVTSGAFVSASALGDWRVACTGDFDGDGNADLILQNGVGQIAAWYLNGSGAVTSGAFVSASALGDWRVH